MSRSSNGSSAVKTRRLSRYMKAPLRVLIHARDFYVRSITSCAAQVQHAEAMGYGPVMSSAVPRSYRGGGHSSAASQQDIMELIRIASVSAAARAAATSPAAKAVPRSQSVAVGRIDEDKPAEFGDDVKVGSDLLMNRSMSYAVGSMRMIKGGRRVVG